MLGSSSELLKVLKRTDPDEAPALLPGIYEGRITKVAGAELHFAIDDFSRDFDFGPVTYERPAAATGVASGHSHDLRTPGATPAVGAKIVVAFISGDPDRPEVLKVKGWPS